jgi:hypothetical protein
MQHKTITFRMGQLSQATDWKARIQFQAEARDLSLFHSVPIRSGPTQPPIQWVPGAISPEEKRPGREADHSPPPSAEVKDSEAIPTLTYVFMVWCLIN